MSHDDSLSGNKVVAIFLFLFLFLFRIGRAGLFVEEIAPLHHRTSSDFVTVPYQQSGKQP